MSPITHTPEEELTEATTTLMSLAEYKTLRKITSTDAARDAQITLSLEIADDVISQYTKRDFVNEPTTTTRRYLYEGSGVLDIDDCTNITAVVLLNRGLAIDQDVHAGPDHGPVSYWLDFAWHGLLPAYSDGVMGFTSNRDKMGEYGFGARRMIFVEVTATFGWPRSEIPASLKQAEAWLVDDFAVSKPDAAGGEGRVSSEAIADLAYSYQVEQAQAQAEIAPRIRALLDPFTRPEL